MRVRKTVGALLGSTALALSLLSVGATTSSAQTTQTFQYHSVTTANGVKVTIRSGTEQIGTVEWRKDADGALPGNALEVRDFGDNTVEVVARLSNGQTASTVNQFDNFDRVLVPGPDGRQLRLTVSPVRGNGSPFPGAVPAYQVTT
ncbi:hypothetical protein JNUCC64_20250 [Streptomyces sp. JNUCC 64]